MTDEDHDKELVKAIVRGMGPVIKEFVQKSIAPLIERINLLESREFQAAREISRVATRIFGDV